MLRALCAVLVLVWAAPAVAQAPARKPRALAGVCGTSNWVCVAECVDTHCVDKCLKQGCEAALGRLKQCTAKSGCGTDDSECVAEKCGPICKRAFEPAPPSPEKEKPDPCAGVAGSPVPEEVVGTWELSAASIEAGAIENPAAEEPSPRPDYVRTLEVTPGGCFILQTRLEDATLGRGNTLVVRAWGTFEVSEKEQVVLHIRDGQAVGPVCGDERVMPLAKGRFRGPPYTFDVDKDTLTLTAKAASKQTFQFQRVPRKQEEASKE